MNSERRKTPAKRGFFYFEAERGTTAYRQARGLPTLAFEGKAVSTNATLPPADQPAAALLDVRAVGRLLGCSARHVYRLCDAARMPLPVRLGALVRWRRQEIAEWIAAGCPDLRKGAG